MILFGSYARGEAHVDSDIDLRLEVDREQGFGLFALSAFGEAVRNETGKQVDLVSSDYLDDDLAAVIEREGVILMIARKSDSLRAQEVLMPFLKRTSASRFLISPRTSFCMRMTCGRGRWRTPF